VSLIELGHLVTGPFISKRAAVLLSLTVPGDPLSKQRPRWNLKTATPYTPGETRHREASIAALARSQRTELSVDPMGLFALRVGFYLKGNQRRDVDNMLKLVADALTGVIWQDDSQVVEVFGFKVPADQPREARTEIAVLRMPGLMPYTFATCLICQRPFRTYPSWRFRTCCSKRCWGLSIRRRVTLTCAQCGKHFETKAHRATAVAPLCSLACKRVYGSESRQCLQCGARFTAARSTKRKTCSPVCARARRFHATRVTFPSPPVGGQPSAGAGVGRISKDGP